MYRGLLARETQIRTELGSDLRRLFRIDDQAAALRRAARADLGDIGDEAVVVRDLFADRDVAQRDPPRADRLRLVIPLREHLGVRIARVIEPARLLDEVPE